MTNAPDTTQALLLTEGSISAVQPASLSDFNNVKVIDLSHNHISELSKESFRDLPLLHTLLLDHNFLTNQALQGGALTNLTQLQVLALGNNLITVIFYNGRRMVCVSTDNPAVTTVLELTEANCVPSNQNITVQVETRGNVTPRLYARDLAITAVICFIGGVGLTLLVVLVYCQVSHRKKLKESKRQKEDEEGSTTVIRNHVSHLDVSEKMRDGFLQVSSGQPLDRKTMILDERLENSGGHFRFRANEDGSHFRCPNCSTKGQRGMEPNPLRWSNRINRENEAEEEREKRRMRQQGILSRDIPNKPLSHGSSNSYSHPRRETFNERPETLLAYKTGRDGDSYRTDVESKSSRHETLNCESCHRTYRPPEQTIKPERIHTNMRDSALFDSFPPLHRLTDNGRNVNHNQFDMMKNTELRRESRNVTFNLECLRTSEQRNIQGENKREEKARTSRDKEKGRKRRHKVKIQSGRLLKVKLNLSPLRKSKVHPKRKNEQLDKGSSKKSKEKRQDGKERDEKEGKSDSGKKTKGSSKKMKKSTKSTGLSEKEEEKEDGGEGQNTRTSKQKKTTSKTEQGGQENTEANQNAHPDNSQPAIVTGQGQNLQGGSSQYHGAGLVLGSAQLPSQLPFSLGNRTTNLSLLGSAGSQLTGSSLSLQGGNILLNTTVPGSNALFPGGPANSVAPGIAISGPSLTSGGALNSFSRQTGVGVMCPAPSRLANTVHANPMQASAIQTTPLLNSQAGGLALNLAANPALNPAPIQSLPQSQLPDSSPLVARLKHDSVQGPGLQSQEGPHQSLPESQAPQTKESLPVQAQALPGTDGLSGVASLGSVTTVENLSDNNNQTATGCVPGGSAVNTSAGGMVQTEGLALGVANGSVSGVSAPTAAQSGSSTDGAAVAAAGTTLLQQEYVSEEGGSSPRRKLRLVLPEKTSSRPPTALERKIR
ncbi:uncharacterized protein AKAME5_001359000 [Lates japonicus]|uniref:Uncharacterized protein n=1 Tax=Lates japonicus TaxID=270547 RepID=A0AAD3RBF5_LATJO|nr:uncharacterized protein AKAME5_001359000 [Lates japonicus]